MSSYAGLQGSPDLKISAVGGIIEEELLAVQVCNTSSLAGGSLAICILRCHMLLLLPRAV
jgi:hypothetical protein